MCFRVLGRTVTWNEPFRKRGWEVIVITEEDDIASEYGINKVKNAITQPGDVLWHSQPCTGGCPWQIVNAKRSHATKLKIDAHWKEFARLWNAFQIVAQHAIDVGASVYHEWPRGCMYWGNRKVALAKHTIRRGDCKTPFVIHKVR